MLLIVKSRNMRHRPYLQKVIPPAQTPLTFLLTDYRVLSQCMCVVTDAMESHFLQNKKCSSLQLILLPSPITHGTRINHNSGSANSQHHHDVEGSPTTTTPTTPIIEHGPPSTSFVATAPSPSLGFSHISVSSWWYIRVLY